MSIKIVTVPRYNTHMFLCIMKRKIHISKVLQLPQYFHLKSSDGTNFFDDFYLSKYTITFLHHDIVIWIFLNPTSSTNWYFPTIHIIFFNYNRQFQ